MIFQGRDIPSVTENSVTSQKQLSRLSTKQLQNPEVSGKIYHQKHLQDSLGSHWNRPAAGICELMLLEIYAANDTMMCCDCDDTQK